MEELHAAVEERWASNLVCSATGVEAPLDEPAFVSPAGKPWLVRYQLDRDRGRRLRERLADRPWTLWRYREVLPVRDARGRVDLGEGGTPLLRLAALAPPGVELWLKEEGGNPTGSFKARGLSLAVNRARELGAPGVQLPSAGNAALALAAYAAAAGLPARVAMPEDTPRTILERCRLHGAEVLTCAGTLVEAGRLLAQRDDGFWTLATLREPYRVEGKKTMLYEIAEQMGWRLPDWIVYPTGGGTGIVGMRRAYDELVALGLVDDPMPRFVAVQMAGCAPIVRAFDTDRDAAEPWPNASTRVWGLRVPSAIGDFLVLRALRESGGAAVAVEEEAIAGMTARAAREEGLLIGPEGAAALLALEALARAGRVAEGERVVVFQTGHPGNYK
ncbi:MAG TPA: threonine synthase [Thermoanaerobaculia bacterium]|nr:threonine synthase [Thermoanaerobaculia bacterium]